MGARQARVRLEAARHVGEARSVVGPGAGQHLVGDERAVASEGGPDDIVDRPRQGVAEPGPLTAVRRWPLGSGGGHERPILVGLDEELVELGEHPLGRRARRDPARDELVAADRDLAVQPGAHRRPAREQRPAGGGRVGRLERLQVEEGDLGTVERIHRPARHAALAQVQLHRQVRDEGAGRHPVRRRQRPGRDGSRPLEQRTRGGDDGRDGGRVVVGQAVVEPVVADDRRVDGVGRHRHVPRLGRQRCEVGIDGRVGRPVRRQVRSCRAS